MSENNINTNEPEAGPNTLEAIPTVDPDKYIWDGEDFSSAEGDEHEGEELTQEDEPDQGQTLEVVAEETE